MTPVLWECLILVFYRPVTVKDIWKIEDIKNAKKQKRYRDKQNKEVQREKYRIRKTISCENLKQQAKNCRILWNKKENNQGTSPDNNPPGPAIAKMSFPSFSRSLKKAQKSLPKEPTQRHVITKALFEDSIHATWKKIRLLSAWSNVQQKTWKIGHPSTITETIKEKLDAFLCRNDISFKLSGQNNQVYMGKNEEGESLFKSKKYLLWTFRGLHGILTQEEDEDLSSFKFSKMYHYTRSQREYIIQSRIPEVSCLCLDCKNLELMIDSIQKACNHQINLPSKCHDLIKQHAIQ